jgi:RHS repeat-associated protein
MSYYYTRDHLGSVREMCNSSGTIVARYGYDPYGAPPPGYSTNLVSGTNVATKQYAGMYMHQPSGLYLTSIGNTYDANTGRWIGRDLLGEGSSLNLYAYIGNDPIDWVDPPGLARSPAQNLGGGYTAEVDSYNTGGVSSYEIHVSDSAGNEVGVLGQNGWIPKHGFSTPPDLPPEVRNALNGLNIAQARARGYCPVKGRANIKGWLGRLGELGAIAGVIYAASQGDGYGAMDSMFPISPMGTAQTLAPIVGPILHPPEAGAPSSSPYTDGSAVNSAPVNPTPPSPQ